MLRIGEPSWNRRLSDEYGKEYFRRLEEFVDAEYARTECYPPNDLIFAALERTPFDRVKAVIMGQDPYHEPGQAQGLAFYVPPGIRTPPSLANIAREVGHVPDLSSWADQGVLLLNDVLTVVAHKAFSHRRKGWEGFTSAVIRRLSEERENLVFLMWGQPAARKVESVDRTRHLVLTAPHPSPLSAYRGFIGCGHFRLCNEYLVSHGIPPIEW